MEGKNVRRRLIQSTLFPHMDSAIKEGENCGGDRGEVVEEDDEEWCSSSKKRRVTKRIGNSKSKTTPRASSKKDMENGKETSSKQVDNSDSPVITKLSFFVKASERRQQKRQQNQLVFDDSPEENDKICSTPSSVPNGRSTPQKLKQQQSKSTPRKEKRNSTPSKKTKSGKRELHCGQIPFDLPVDENPLQKIPDLRLEAKLMAEENARIFSGRQIHPFFTSWKGGKASQDLTDSESKWSYSERKDKGIAFNPIHVFGNVEDDHTPLNWGHWVFSERSPAGDLQPGSSPVYEGSIDSLNFDNLMNVSHFTRTSLCRNSHTCSVPQKEVSAELLDNPECSHMLLSLSSPDKDSHMLSKCTEDVLAVPVELNLQDHKHEKNDFVDGIPCCGNLESEFQNKLLHERIMSYYHACQNQPQNCLWTDKYQPQNAKQTCGNGQSVKYLSEWLHLWHKRSSLTIRGGVNEDNSIVKDVDLDHDYQPSDSDNNDEERLKNVLLVTGPVGSGKSAAIYACARDQGFQIIEINASDWRNGALVKQKFGEAVESHWLQRTNPDYKFPSKFFKAVNVETPCFDDEVIELRHILDKEDSQDSCSSPLKSVAVYNGTANCQNVVKTLILFEDVDATLYEDHGFISAIHQLAETAKRPMLLTSNSDSPVLPKNLDKLQLSFSVPSVEELLGLLNAICAAEKAIIHPCLLERFVDYCQRDIRKAIILLQFWFQGQALGRGNELQTTYWPVPFDLDAGHDILPKVARWGYRSRLSELLAEEVDKSLTLADETQGLTDRNKVDELNCHRMENLCMQDIEPDPVEVKKTRMLRLRCSSDEVECTPFEADHELLDFFCSPVECVQTNKRRKINTVLSSDSEGEFTCGSIPLVSAAADISAGVHETKFNSPFHCLSTEMNQPLAEPIFQSVVDKLEENYCQLPERVYCSHTEDTCKSHDMSFVPESSFVPETEIIQETELFSTTATYGDFVNIEGSNCIFQYQNSIPILETAGGAQSSKSLHGLQNDLETLRNNFDTSTARLYQEAVGDSLSKSEADVPRGFQLLDECSRMDFMRKLKSLDNFEADDATDIVSETWKRLRGQCKDFKEYITAEEKAGCQVLGFTHGINSLISEVDLLQKGCQTHLFDSLGSSMIPSEKSESYSYYDNQLAMSSILAQHGMCFYAMEIASLGSIMGYPNTLDLASEMLSSSSSSVALGKLATQDMRNVNNKSSTQRTKSSVTSTSKADSCLCNILQTIVPSKSYLAAKGDAFHEYISTLSQISRYEPYNSSECINSRRKQRRSRVARHYLSSGSLSMSPEEITLLGRYNRYQKDPSLHRDESFR